MAGLISELGVGAAVIAGYDRPLSTTSRTSTERRSHRLGEFFSDATLHVLAGVGHFSPLEAPKRFASAIRDALGTGEARD